MWIGVRRVVVRPKIYVRVYGGMRRAVRKRNGATGEIYSPEVFRIRHALERELSNHVPYKPLCGEMAPMSGTQVERERSGVGMSVNGS